MSEKCEPTPACKYWQHPQHPCPFEDTHHIYTRPQINELPQPEHKIARKFRELPENKIQLCRVNHEKIHEQGIRIDLPDIDFMLEAVLRWREERYNGNM